MTTRWTDERMAEAKRLRYERAAARHAARMAAARAEALEAIKADFRAIRERHRSAGG
jgi:hypothetical protein